MILAIEELDAAPANPAQWDRYYNSLDDKIYIETVLSTDPSYPTWVEMATGAAVREDMRITGTLTRSKYSAKDFQTYKDQIVAWLYEKYGDSFNDFMSSDPAIMIVEYVSAALDQMSWYLDREADEWYLELARLTKNIARMARSLGYKATPAVSGTTDEVITLSSGPYGFDVPIYKGHKFEGPNSLVFEADSDQVVPAGLLEKTITVYQGETFTEVFSSNGDPKQVFNLSLIPSDRYLAQGKTICKIDNVLWTEEEVLPYSDIESYEINYLNDPPQLRFGDGVIGSIPSVGAEIRISYVATAGKLAMNAIANSIQTSLTTVIVNFNEIPITVTNPEGVSAASDPETNASIVANAPKYYDAADRLVTKRDIETLSGHFSDPLYGAVAKSNALSIRGVEQDLQLSALLDAIISGVDLLDGYMDSIFTEQENIESITGAAEIVNSIRWVIEQIKATDTPAIRAQTTLITGSIAVSKNNIENIRTDIEAAKTRLNYLPAQQVVGYGDSVKFNFSTTLTQNPIQEGSVAVFLNNKNPDDTSNDGDCDAVPGRLSSASVNFTGLEGKLIKIGGEFRQILKVNSSSSITYSGPRIYGTSLIVEVYPSAIIGYDDGASSITGTGIASGSITYSSGALSIDFSTAPAGISGEYGVAILCTYQYVGEGIQGVLDDALDDCDSTDTSIDEFDTIGTAIDTIADTIDSNIDIASTGTDGIDASALQSKQDAQAAKAVPLQMSEDIVAVEAYLDTVISGECKANIIRISFLVLDAEGFYIAPSLSLIKALQSYMDDRRIETVRYSVVSGDYYLLLTDMTIEIKVLEQYIYSEVSGRVETKAKEILKDRDYGVSLTRKEYYDQLNLDGVDYLNITISGTEWAINIGSPIVINPDITPEPDSQGNLFINEDVIISKGTLTLSEITT